MPYLLPLLAAFTSWLAVFLAGLLLFRVILPRKREALIEQISEHVSREVSLAPIKEKIADPATVKKIMPMVEEHIDDFLRNKLKQKFPMIGLLIGDKTIGSLKEIFLKEIEELFPVVLEKFAGNLEQEIRVKEMVAEKLSSVPLSRLEKPLAPALRLFQVAAALGGFLGGLLVLLLG